MMLHRHFELLNEEARDAMTTLADVAPQTEPVTAEAPAPEEDKPKRRGRQRKTDE